VAESDDTSGMITYPVQPASSRRSRTSSVRF
jgi:hypothetical protein